MSSDSNTVSRPFDELISGIDRGAPHEFVVDELSPTHVVKPGSVDELSEIVRSARVDGLAVIPWGGGTQMGLGNVPSSYDVAIDLSGINEVLRYDPDDMTMSVQAGCRLQDLNRMLGDNRQVLPVDAALPDKATIGGITAVGASGPRRLGYGPLRDLIIGMSVVSVDGIIAKAGGQVVKNVTGFDMMRLHHGALGSLGIIVSINLKVIPKPQSERTVSATFLDFDKADEAAKEVLRSQLGVTSLVLMNAAASAEITGRAAPGWILAVRCEAPPSAVVRQAERVTGYISDGAESVDIEESSDISESRWLSICQALDQRQNRSEIAVRIGRAASRLKALRTELNHNFDLSGNARLTLDYGSGLGYLRASAEEIEQSDWQNRFESLTRLGDHITLLSGPVSLKRDIDVFGGPAAGFSMIEALKTTFDPDRTLNPGRSVGRL